MEINIKPLATVSRCRLCDGSASAFNTHMKYQILGAVNDTAKPRQGHAVSGGATMSGWLASLRMWDALERRQVSAYG